MLPDTDTTTIRTYGNWRRPRSPGVWGLGTAGTAGMIGGAILAVVALYAAGILAACAVAAIDAVLVALLRARDRHGRTLSARIGMRARWAGTVARGRHRHHGGPLSSSETFRLPGLGAPTRLLEADDVYGDPFAVVHHPRGQRYTAVLVTEPDGASLVDADQVDGWVAGWGAWLSSLADEPGLVAAGVTVEAAPDSGTRLRREVATNLHPEAPGLARAMLDEVVRDYPAGSAIVRAYVSLTFTGQRRAPHTTGWRTLAAQIWEATLGARTAKVRDDEGMLRDLGQRLPALAHGLAATGAGAARPLAAQGICEAVRCAYDPDAQDVLDEARTTGETAELGWGDVGPAGAEEGWDHYRHDGAWSITWSMSGAPRGEVHARVLEALLQPHRDVARKRVTMIYRVLDGAASARVVEHDKHTVAFLLGDEKRPSQRLLQEQAMAEANAVDEARGASIADFALFVTATVRKREQLDAARYAIEPLASRARITLRVETGAQAAAFAQTLPLGLGA